MKISKLLNKNCLSIILILLFGLNSFAEDQPVDIWNIDKDKLETNSLSDDDKAPKAEIVIETEFKSNVYKMQSEKEVNAINLEDRLDSQEIKIVGLYDPDDYDLNINMWSNTNGDQLKILFDKLNKMPLSNDAVEIINISLLTNSYYPQKNITEKEFQKFKSDWLIKNSNLELIEEYLIKNQIINLHPKLTKFLVDQYLSDTNIKKACEIFSKNTEPIFDEYLSKFNIYCLIKDNKKEEAQLILDLKKELGFKDKYFEKKINYLLEYTDKIDDEISEKSIFDFYLAHQTNPNFNFEPNDKTVVGWDDPRLPTIKGIRRRGFTPRSIRNFCDYIGVAKKESLLDFSMLEYFLREDLNVSAERKMCVLDPIKVIITNYSEKETETIMVANHPQDSSMGQRERVFSKIIYIDRDDFREQAESKFHRLTEGKEVRLRYGYIIRCDKVVKDSNTQRITELHCSYDPKTLGKKPEGRKVKGVIHWISEKDALPAVFNIYDRLIKESVPENINFGDAHISKKHSNFFVNKNNASFDEMNSLINFVKKNVKEKTGVSINLEIKVID